MKRVINVLARIMLRGMWIFVLWFIASTFTVWFGHVSGTPDATIYRLVTGESLIAVILWAVYVIKIATE